MPEALTCPGHAWIFFFSASMIRESSPDLQLGMWPHLAVGLVHATDFLCPQNFLVVLDCFGRPLNHEMGEMGCSLWDVSSLYSIHDFPSFGS